MARERDILRLSNYAIKSRKGGGGALRRYAEARAEEGDARGGQQVRGQTEVMIEAEI